MKQEKTFQELSAHEIVAALIADDEEVKEFESELLETITAMKNGDHNDTRETKIAVSPITSARHKMQLTQPKFAELLGVSASAVRAWEQGKRQPSGTAQRLIQLLTLHPELAKELTI